MKHVLTMFLLALLPAAAFAMTAEQLKGDWIPVPEATIKAAKAAAAAEGGTAKRQGGPQEGFGRAAQGHGNAGKDQAGLQL